jgi:uncharacterized protein (TIRG00374 family)
MGGVLVLVVALGAMAWRVDWRTTAASVASADALLLVVAIAINLLSLALKGVRWWVLLRPLGVRSFRLVLGATFAGASLNNLVVAQGGEGARVLLVSRASGVSSASVLAALALERALDAVSYVTLLCVAAWTLDVPPVIARWRMGASIALVLVVAILVALSRGARTSHTLAGEAVGRVRSYLRRFHGGVRKAGTPWRVTGAMALSLGAWALQVATYHLVARAAHLDVPIAASVTAMLAVGLSFLIRATPGNVGVFQAVYAVALRSFGVAEAPAVAAALLIQAVQVLPIVLIGSLVTPALVRLSADPSLRSG